MLPETLVSRGVREENASKSSLTRRVTKQGHLLLTAFVGQRHVGLAVLALATVFALRTVASAKSANSFGNAAISKHSMQRGAVQLGWRKNWVPEVVSTEFGIQDASHLTFAR